MGYTLYFVCEVWLVSLCRKGLYVFHSVFQVLASCGRCQCVEKAHVGLTLKFKC